MEVVGLVFGERRLENGSGKTKISSGRWRKAVEKIGKQKTEESLEDRKYLNAQVGGKLEDRKEAR